MYPSDHAPHHFVNILNHGLRPQFTITHPRAIVVHNHLPARSRSSQSSVQHLPHAIAVHDRSSQSTIYVRSQLTIIAHDCLPARNYASWSSACTGSQFAIIGHDLLPAHDHSSQSSANRLTRAIMVLNHSPWSSACARSKFTIACLRAITVHDHSSWSQFVIIAHDHSPWS